MQAHTQERSIPFLPGERKEARKLREALRGRKLVPMLATCVLLFVIINVDN